MRTPAAKRPVTIFLCLVFTGFFSPQSPAASKDEIEKAGDFIQVLIPAIAYGTTFYLHDTEGRAQFYKSFFTSLGVTHGLKYSIDKKRPDGGDRSFPSGHTSAAFQGAAFIHRRYGWNYGLPAYIGATYVGYSRVESDRHYPEDVVAGALIGIFSSFYFTTPGKGAEITPVAGNGFYGISLKAEF